MNVLGPIIRKRYKQTKTLISTNKFMQIWLLYQYIYHYNLTYNVPRRRPPWVAQPSSEDTLGEHELKGDLPGIGHLEVR
jgi:hypothetical protein